MTDLTTLVAILGAAVSCAAAVIAVLFIRRGTDAELKTDVQELALLVERLAKANRREKMARVRAAGSSSEPVNPNPPVDFPIDPKTALRRQIAARMRVEQ